MARTSECYVTYIIPDARNVYNIGQEGIAVVKEQGAGQKVRGPAGADVLESELFVGFLE